MKTSADRILTTHTGSLPRPAGLDRHDPAAVRAAVAETVSRQRDAGVDVVNDGEVSKAGYSTYVTERLSGFGGEPVPVRRRGYDQFPDFYRKMFGDPQLAVVSDNPSCDGPVAYLDTSLVEADIANRGRPPGEPGTVGALGPHAVTQDPGLPGLAGVRHDQP
jgi:5-methyltetrahydropteroyltriglutamate--homocysteine methyltransferase